MLVIAQLQETMYITACKENDNEHVFPIDEDFIEAVKLQEDPETEEDKLYEFYKSYLQRTEENFNQTKEEISLEDAKERFLELQELLLQSLKTTEDDYTLCPELECPVCLTEMLPPIKIWTCKSGHTLCQNCKRNPNIGRKCPTCRQQIIGRATSLEKIVAAMYRKMTGREAPVEAGADIDLVVDEDSSDDSNPSSFIEIPFLPEILFGQPRNREEALERELNRLFSNVSLITGNRPHIHNE